MEEKDCWKLFNLLRHYLMVHVKTRGLKKKYMLNPLIVPNGLIRDVSQLSMAIWYYADGSPFDRMISHVVGYSDVYKSI